MFMTKISSTYRISITVLSNSIKIISLKTQADSA